MEKISLVIIVISFVVIGCRKDEFQNGTHYCTHFEPTDISHDTLFIEGFAGVDLYDKDLSTHSQSEDLFLDVNCDGKSDFQIDLFMDNEYHYDYDITEASITFRSLNPDVYVLCENKVDSLYLADYDDTVGNVITHYNITSSYPSTEGVLSSTETVNYVKGFAEGDTILGNNSNWSNGDVIISRAYQNIFAWPAGGDSTYEHNIHEEILYDQGAMTSAQDHIAIKFDNGSFTKLGYLKLNQNTSGSWAYSSYHYFRMHR